MSNDKLREEVKLEADKIKLVAKHLGFVPQSLLGSKATKEVYDDVLTLIEEQGLGVSLAATKPGTEIKATNQYKAEFGNMNSARELANSVLPNKFSKEDWENGNVPSLIDTEARRFSNEKMLSGHINSGAER